ncbi:MAG: SIMPL domain-containing protein [Christensenellaceae bacterium]|nr:SIMPL domain-containing protein [Christensenellaceae bacterium]MDY2850517.1 SIMPL domain-containing protein [Christensenellaceae bacterium]
MKTITVKGVGKVSVKPDLIVVSMTLTSEDKEYEKTMELAAEKIKLVTEKIEKIDFEKDAIKTKDFHVNTNYESVKNKNGAYERVFKGYSCIQRVRIEFDFDTKTLAKVLSAISACLANPELSVSFTVKDPSSVSEELLRAAARNAREKAEILCDASGVKLGALASVDYSWGEVNVYSETDYSVDRACMLKAASGIANIDIEPDDIKVNDSATFVWEIL